MTRQKIIPLFFCLLFFACDETIYVGNSASGFKEMPMAVSPAEALKKAEPYLDKTYALRLKSRLSPMDRPLSDTIVRHGSWYYISRDNYPYKAIRAYLNHAVRVHVTTGRVIPPAEN